jgi:hypothetical protein
MCTSHAPTEKEFVMKNRAIGVGLAALLMIGGTIAANAATNITSPETITTVGTVVKDKDVDVGKQGPSVGDTYAWTLDIKSQAGVDLGTERTQCTLGTGRWATCTGAFDITGRGEIVGTGMVNFGSESLDFDVPITGGRGTSRTSAVWRTFTRRRTARRTC